MPRGRRADEASSACSRTASPSPGRGCVPHGRGPVNPAGLDFYDRLVDELLGAGHPADRHALPLGPAAGARGRGRLGDPVDRRGASPSTRPPSPRRSATGSTTWTTLNEPWCSAFLGYASGVHAPGRTDGESALRAVHHLNLAHGLACQAVRAVLPAARMSVTHNLHVVHPADPASADDLDLVRRIDALGNRAFLQPQLEGVLPEDLVARHRARDRLGASSRTATSRRSTSPSTCSASTTTRRLVVQKWDGVSPRVMERRAHGQRARAVGRDRRRRLRPRGRAAHRDGVARRARPASPSCSCGPAAATPTCRSWSPRTVPPSTTRSSSRPTAAVHDELTHGLRTASPASPSATRWTPARTCAATTLWSLLDNFEWAWGYDRAVRHHPRRLRDAGAGPQGLGAVLRRRHRRERRLTRPDTGNPTSCRPPARQGVEFRVSGQGGWGTWRTRAAGSTTSR